MKLGVVTFGPGLSPRVRGNLVCRIEPTENERSIPACAGEPIICTYRIAFLPVYPRVCGGTTIGIACIR